MTANSLKLSLHRMVGGATPDEPMWILLKLSGLV